MTPHFRRASFQAAIIIAAATSIGMLYSGTMKKGLFDVPGVGTPHEETAPGSTFVTLEDAGRLYTSQPVLFIDSRNPADFAAGHIPGALNLPLHVMRQDHPILSALEKDHLYIVYCDGEACSSSLKLAQLLFASGFSQVKVFFAGWNAWSASNMPREP